MQGDWLVMEREDEEKKEIDKEEVVWKKYCPRGIYISAGVEFQNRAAFLLDEAHLDRLPHIEIPNAYARKAQWIAAIMSHNPKTQKFHCDYFESYAKAREAWKSMWLGSELWLKFMIASPVHSPKRRNQVYIDGYIWRLAAKFGRMPSTPKNPLYLKHRFLNTIPDYGLRTRYASYDTERDAVGALYKLWELIAPIAPKNDVSQRVLDPPEPQDGDIILLRAIRAHKRFAVLIKDDHIWSIYELAGRGLAVMKTPLGAWLDQALSLPQASFTRITDVNRLKPGAYHSFFPASTSSHSTTLNDTIRLFSGSQHFFTSNRSKVRQTTTVLRRKQPADIHTFCHEALQQAHPFARSGDFALAACFTVHHLELRQSSVTDDASPLSSTTTAQLPPPPLPPPAADSSSTSAAAAVVPAQ